MTNRPSTATVIGVEDILDGVRTTCRFNGAVHNPLAPASLHSDPMSESAVLELHRIRSCDGDTVTFETFGITRESVPQVGQSLYYRAWLIPDAVQAALDRNAIWEHRQYPDNGDHDHCLFTWETIAAYVPTRTGYWCREHGRITERAYEDFIRDDIYRLRGNYSK